MIAVTLIWEGQGEFSLTSWLQYFGRASLCLETPEASKISLSKADHCHLFDGSGESGDSERGVERRPQHVIIFIFTYLFIIITFFGGWRGVGGVDKETLAAKMRRKRYPAGQMMALQVNPYVPFRHCRCPKRFTHWCRLPYHRPNP